MKIQIRNEKTFKLIWWTVFTLNLVLVCTVTYVAIHFLKKYW